MHEVKQFRRLKESESEVAQSCPTLCDPMDYSLPGFSDHGIFQARVLEWGTIAFSVSFPSLVYYRGQDLLCGSYCDRVSTAEEGKIGR